VALETAAVAMRGAWDVPAVLRLARVIRREKVDLVHTHSSIDAWVGGAAARLARVPVVRSRHVSIPIRAGLNPVYTWLADRVLTSGEAIRALVLAGGVRPEAVRAVAAGVDLARFTPGERSEALLREFGPARPVIGSIAMFRGSKGHPHLLDAFERLRPEFPQARLVLVGDGVRRARRGSWSPPRIRPRGPRRLARCCGTPWPPGGARRRRRRSWRGGTPATAASTGCSPSTESSGDDPPARRQPLVDGKRGLDRHALPRAPRARAPGHARDDPRRSLRSEGAGGGDRALDRGHARGQAVARRDRAGRARPGAADRRRGRRAGARPPLPRSLAGGGRPAARRARPDVPQRAGGPGGLAERLAPRAYRGVDRGERVDRGALPAGRAAARAAQIGRASCRERVWS